MRVYTETAKEQTMFKKIGKSLVAFSILTTAGSGLAFGQHDHSKHGEHAEATGHSHASAEIHGGSVTMTKEFHFEVAFDRDAVYVFGYDSKQAPISLDGASGTVTIDFRDKKHKSIEAPLHFMKASLGDATSGNISQPMDAGFLMAKVDLAQVEEGQAKATFSITGLKGKEEKDVQFRETFGLAMLTEYACPMNDTEPAMAPGKCTKCGMSLERQRYIYACEEHPTVTSRMSGEKCWKDGKAMHRLDPNAEKHAEEKDDHDHSGHHH